MALARHVVRRRTLPGHQVRVVREAFHCAWLHVLQLGDRVPRAWSAGLLAAALRFTNETLV
ncbi:protein of unknown function [Cupriavidus taiwanensis]|nr:protein of unknown function [Cupriavidus taiwanensis]